MKTSTLICLIYALFIIPFGLSYPVKTHAAAYAVLVGVGKYAQAPLAGPVNDVEVMHRVLQNKWGFKKENIEVLLNEQGTKKNILSAIQNLYTKSNPGDQIFIFLSGHGTSASDEDLEIPLPTTTGAFIPFDIAGVKTTEELVNHLIIGREDIRPLLKKLDDGNRNIFVAIDACYSGNTVRGAFKKNKLQKRYLDLSRLLPRSAFSNNQVSIENNSAKKDPGNNDQSYPYKHVYYLSASGEHEPAQDIPPEMVAEYPTIDGKPHGAFSDTLLRILNKNIDSDTNNDGSISYSELKQTVRAQMSARGFEHSPQGLPTIIDDKTNLGKQALFGMASARGLKLASRNNSSPAKTTRDSADKTSVTIGNTPSINSTNKLKVSIDPSLSRLIQAVRQSNIALIVDNQPDIEIRRLNSDVLFISNAGDLVASLANPDEKTMMFNIAHQAWIHQIINQPFSQQFNLDIEMIGNGRGGTAVEGELIGFSIKSTEDAYILLLDIDSQGTINVIYPFTPDELNPVKANKTLRLNDISEVAAPFGRDSIQVYAFKEATLEYDALRGKTFILGSADAAKLERLIYPNNLTKARASMELVTIKRN